MSKRNANLIALTTFLIGSSFCAYAQENDSFNMTVTGTIDKYCELTINYDDSAGKQIQAGAPPVSLTHHSGDEFYLVGSSSISANCYGSEYVVNFYTDDVGPQIHSDDNYQIAVTAEMLDAWGGGYATEHFFDNGASTNGYFATSAGGGAYSNTFTAIFRSYIAPIKGGLNNLPDTFSTVVPITIVFNEQ